MGENPLGSQRSMAHGQNNSNEVPNSYTAHASLYMRDKKRSDSSKADRDTKTGKCVADKEAYRKKK